MATPTATCCGGADSFLPDGAVTSSTGTLLTKVSDTKYTTGSAFTTVAGVVVGTRKNGSEARVYGPKAYSVAFQPSA